MGTVRKTAKPSVNVLDLLTEQHQEVDALFEQLEADRGDRAALFSELADKLGAHAAIEEKIFYPAVMSAETEEALHESVEEHLAMKRLLADLITMQLSDDDFKAKLSVLQEIVSHHAHEEEEASLFKQLRASMDADVLGALGNECLALFEELMQTHPAKLIPAQTKQAAPLPPVQK
ncbi:MAG: hemerythrin domain-containing protein [Deltaproteobacteria bacterium]|nr:hemerythrin domain-containing protein [Deltaproteobacteria bacterium]